jgi:hypothetical protein
MSVVINNIRDAVSLNTDNTRFNLEIEHPQFGWIPYTLDPTDDDKMIDNDALLALIGDDFTAYVPPTQAELDAQAAHAVRAERDMKLVTQVDPIAGNTLRWASLTVEQQQAWADYRQALLDVPTQDGFPHDVVWPTKP